MKENVFADPHEIAPTLGFEPWRALYPSGGANHSNLPPNALDMFQTAVASDPKAPAIFYFDAVLEYGTLDDLSNRLAHHWRGHGLEKGDRIAIILQNQPSFVIATVAAWKIGAIPVAINPMYRVPELERLFADCEPRAILCLDVDLDGIVAAAAGRIAPGLLLTTTPHEFQKRDDLRVLPLRGAAINSNVDVQTVLESVGPRQLRADLASAEDVALVLYTSGTTGVPKGAMLTHRNLTVNAVLCRDWFSLDKTSRIFGVAPLFHITGFEIHLCAAFIAAAPMILTYRFAAAVALDAFREQRPSFMIAAITVYGAMMQLPEATAEDFRSFTHLYSGGAPIPPATIVKFANRFGKDVRSSYGMTETTAPTHFAPPHGVIPVDPESGSLSIGIPVPGTEAEVVNEERRPLPIGEIGEIRVRGRQVMLGYWRKPAETAEVLEAGWMYTGDIGFRDQAGWFFIVDRKKDVIIASGFKVWPREVEDVLYTHADVHEVAVVGVQDAYRGETVVAFVALVAGAQTNAEALTVFCRARLAAYKCPRTITILTELPKTVSGKIVRATLRKEAQASQNSVERN